LIYQSINKTHVYNAICCKLKTCKSSCFKVGYTIVWFGVTSAYADGLWYKLLIRSMSKVTF